MNPDQIAVGAMVVSAFYFGARALQAKQKASVQKGLIEKFSSASDLGTFLSSPGGERFMQGVTEGSYDVKRSAVKSVQTGVILLFCGAGMLGAGANGWADEMFRGVGLVLMFIGAGFLVAAGVAWKLSGAVRNGRD